MLKKALIGLSFVAALALGYHVYDIHPDPEPNMHQAFSASVQLDDFCSGTVIPDPDLTDGEQVTVISAKHCVKSVGDVIPIRIPNYIQDRKAGETSFDFKVVAISDKSDLSILQTEMTTEWIAQKITPIDVYGGMVSFGDRVVAVAFPAGLPKTVTEGFLGYVEEVLAFDTISDSNEFRRASAQASGGSSGGSLLRWTDEGYKLVGVLTGGMQGFITYWTPLEEIQGYLSSVDIDGVEVKQEA